MTNFDWSAYASCACPRCGGHVDGFFPSVCPFCGLSTNTLANMGTTSFQMRKTREHTDLLYGTDISFYGKKYNASFNFYGNANLQDIVRYTITYGAQIPIQSRNTSVKAILAYCPEVLGIGTTIGQDTQVPCSGVCLVSPQSTDWGHAIPVIDDWVKTRYGSFSSRCIICGLSTSVGVPLCEGCYLSHTSSWREMIGL